MMKLLGVCLGVLLCWSVSLGGNEAFGVADRVGEPDARCFFLLSTSAGSYTIRQDGWGEFTSPKGMRRVFTLQVGAKARIDQVYFLEHERDLFLFYQVHDATSQSAFLVRMEQTKRKLRWITAVDNVDIAAPTIREGYVVIKNTEISKADGHVRGN